MTTTTVLLAHGSPDPRHAATVLALCNRVEAQLGTPTQTAFLQHNEPTLTSFAPAECRVLPLLVGSGEHLEADVPEAARGFRRISPLPAAELAAALAESIQEFDPRTVELVCAGSSRPNAFAGVQELARVLADQLSLPITVSPSPQEMAESDLSVPIVWSTGVLYDRIQAKARAITPPLADLAQTPAILARHVVQSG